MGLVTMVSADEKRSFSHLRLAMAVAGMNRSTRDSVCTRVSAAYGPWFCLASEAFVTHHPWRVTTACVYDYVSARVFRKKKDNYFLCACWFNWVIWSIVKFSFQSFLAPSSSSTLNFEASYSCDLQWLCESWMQTNHVAAPPACMRTVCN